MKSFEFIKVVRVSSGVEMGRLGRKKTDERGEFQLLES
jgi:hypothetical protein